MAKYYVKIAGMLALSAATVAGTSMWASNAQAAEEETESALEEGNDSNEAVASNDEEMTAESSEAIWRGAWRPYPYGGFYPGYRYGYRPYPYRHYRPFYGPGYRYFPNYYYPPFRYPGFRYYPRW